MSTTIIKEGSHYRVEFDLHYVTEEEIKIIRRYIASLHDENEKLRELVDYMTPIAWYTASERERDRMRELGVEVDEPTINVVEPTTLATDDRGSNGIRE